jgi:hypothetical protein
MAPPGADDCAAAADGDGGGLNLEGRFGFDGAWYKIAGARVVADGPEGKPVLGVSYE